MRSSWVDSFWRLVHAATVIAVLCGCTWLAPAVTYYVRTTGNDANTGLSSGAAFRTVNKAISKATRGSIVYVGAGTYSENFANPRSGTATLPIAFYADVSGATTGDAGVVRLSDTSGNGLSISSRSYLTFDGFTITAPTNVVYLTNSKFIKLVNCTMSSGSGSCAYVTSTSSITFTGCTMSGCGGPGITVLAGSTVVFTGGEIASVGGACVSSPSGANVVTVERSILRDSGGGGVAAASGTIKVTCCLLRSVGAAISISGTSAAVWNNTIVNCSTAATFSCTTTFANNIVSQVSTGLAKSGSAVLTHKNNLYFNNGTNYSGCSAGVGDVYLTPGFISSTNWGIGPTSRAINAGADATGTHTADLDGHVRPYGGGWDIGCYEYGSLATPKPVLVGWTQVAPQ
ncbi:MAG: right-handed parallel beta-helix repeat-containing protein [Planctomycetota bacterium]|nr:right-handed parallel beta-helix repeat-containing protein [Planctomycetota bacterium]